MTPAKLLAKLKEFHREAGPRMYERVCIARQLLDNKEWVMGVGGVSEARQTLQSDYFGDLCGAITLGQALRILEAFPEVEQWAQRKFHLPRLYDDAVAVLCPPRPREARRRQLDLPPLAPLPANPTRAQMAEHIEYLTECNVRAVRNGQIAVADAQKSKEQIAVIEKKLDEVQQQTEDEQEELRRLRKENASLRARICELEKENAELRQMAEIAA